MVAGTPTPPRWGCRVGLRRPETARQASLDRREDQGTGQPCPQLPPGTLPQSCHCRASQLWGQSGPVTWPRVTPQRGESQPRRGQSPAWTPAPNPPSLPCPPLAPQSTLCSERSSWARPVGPTYRSGAGITEGRKSEMCFWATPVPL